MQKTLGGIAGATLGYIGGNLPGAYLGYQLGRMAPISRKRKSTALIPYRAQKKGRFMTKPKTRTETGITTHYDRTTNYRYKRMPKRKKRKWKKFVKRVNAVVNKDLGTTTVVFNKWIGGVSNVQGNQCVCVVHLYGTQGAVEPTSNPQETGQRDIWRIVKNDSRLADASTAGRVNPGTILFKSAVLDMTVRNITENDMEVDCYEIVYNKETDHWSFLAAVQQAEGSTLGVPGNTGGNLALTFRGTTLFDFPNLIKSLNIKILSKRKYFLPAYKYFTLQHRDSGNRKFDVSEFNDIQDANTQGYIKNKYTRSFIFIGKAITGTVDSGAAMNIGVTRKYAYGIMENTHCYDSYNPLE